MRWPFAFTPLSLCALGSDKPGGRTACSGETREKPEDESGSRAESWQADRQVCRFLSLYKSLGVGGKGSFRNPAGPGPKLCNPQLLGNKILTNKIRIGQQANVLGRIITICMAPSELQGPFTDIISINSSNRAFKTRSLKLEHSHQSPLGVPGFFTFD